MYLASSIMPEYPGVFIVMTLDEARSLTNGKPGSGNVGPWLDIHGAYWLRPFDHNLKNLVEDNSRDDMYGIYFTSLSLATLFKMTF